MNRRALWFLVLAAGLVAAACSSGNGDGGVMSSPPADIDGEWRAASWSAGTSQTCSWWPDQDPNDPCECSGYEIWVFSQQDNTFTGTITCESNSRADGPISGELTGNTITLRTSNSCNSLAWSGTVSRSGDELMISMTHIRDVNNPSVQCDLSGCYMGFESIAGPACGDGTVDPGEECDDGNTTDGDGCSSTCTREILCWNAWQLSWAPGQEFRCVEFPNTFDDGPEQGIVTEPWRCEEAALLFGDLYGGPNFWEDTYFLDWNDLSCTQVTPWGDWALTFTDDCVDWLYEQNWQAGFSRQEIIDCVEALEGG